MTTIINDIKYSFRMMLKKPSFAITAVLTLALGIGAVTTMASVFWSVVLRPLPFPESERLVFVQAVTDQGITNSLSGMDYFDYRQQCDTFDSLAAQMIFQKGQLVTGLGDTERVMSIKVSRNLFETLGVHPLHGRSFLPDEEVLGGPPAVVVSHGFWQRKLNSNLDVLGTSLVIGESAYEIVGIMPKDYAYPAGIDLWFPMQKGGPDETDRGNNNFVMIGRLGPNVTLQQAQAQMDSAAHHISETYPDIKGGWGAVVTPLQEQFFGNLRPLMWTLTGATVFLLLIACSNVSSLVLARVLTRRSELAIRQSLGASSWRITRQLLGESLLLITLAALAGAVLAKFGIQMLKVLAPANLPRVQTIGIDPLILILTLSGTTLSAILFTLVPAWRGASINPINAMREGRFAARGTGGMRLRKLLVTAQVAMSLALLVGSGLLMRSLHSLQRVDTGLQPEGLLTVNVQLAETGDNIDQAYPFLPMLERLRSLPDVRAVSAADQLPLFGGPWNGIYREDKPAQTPSERLPATRRIVTQGYFSTMGIPLLAGRDFRPTDTPDSGYVIVVSKALAERLYPEENSLGKNIILPTGSDAGIPLKIIGVANDVRDFGLATADQPAFYLPYQQHPFPPSTMRLVIRADGDPEALVASLRTAINEIHRNAALYQIGTMTGWLANTTAGNRFTSLLCSVFAVAALCLAVTGLYGLLVANVTQQTSEIGVRLALGATPGLVMQRVLVETSRLVGVGVVVGIILAFCITPLIRSQFFDVGPHDPISMVGAVVVLSISSLLACYVPARRAAKIDPMEALRYE